ncbi:MAG: non-homologous end-joining DNA ligase, partial [Gemmatimonadales bacterium]
GVTRGAPEFVPPELATLVDDPPTGAQWVFETKYDGYRLEPVVARGKARLMTRRGKDWTDRFPVLASELGRLPVRTAVLDGEVVVLDRRGRSRFALLQQSLDASRDQDLTFFAFDLLHHDGEDLRRLPLTERRARLEALLRKAGAGPTGPVRLGRRLSGRGATLLRAACRRGLEGIMAKRSDSTYQSRRTMDWVKIKCSNRQEFVIVGYTPPRGSRIDIGSLLLAVHDNGALQYAGRVGSGMDDATLRGLRRRLRPIERATSPLPGRQTGLPREVHWVEPKLVCEVSFTEWTRDGALRHPVFVGIREDKPAREVRRERAAP